ncbi:MAG: ABC transporter substrate-binding protein [Anaerolineaceae bacterium]|nr:ABC transporter substrate-binding protein [Anaerolineaceae bacterium]
MKKLFAILLAAVMLLSVAAVNAEDAHQLIYGASTEISGDFAPGAWWTNNATDKMLRDFTTDYGTVVTDQGGALVINDTTCEDIEGEMNEDGTKTYTVVLNEGLVFNNGDPITIKDFVWPTAFSCSAVSSEVGAKLTGYMDIVGGQEYYDGTASTIKGLRMLDDKTIQISIVADKVPYYFDLNYAGFAPFSMKYWLGEGIDIADDGEGVYFTGLTKDAIEEQLNFARFHAGEDRITAGPYNLVEFDQASKQATLVKNEYYQGNFEGQIPSIEKIIITKAEDATWADALKTGAFNFYDTITDGSQVNTAMDLIEDDENIDKLGYGFDYVQFDRPGYGKLMFHSDFGPTQFINVRHAIAHLLDRNEFANTFCNGWGGVVNGPYGTAMWMYQEAEEWLDENLDNYAYNPEKAVELLIEDGWIYDEKGNDYVEGIRYKKVTPEEAGTYAHNVTLEDGTILMPLIIEWASSEGNSVSDLLSVMLANGEQTAAAGVKINQNVMSFAELLNYMYRDATQGDKYGVPTYCMYNLASNFTSLYDQAYSFTLDPKLVADGYNSDFIFDEELDKLSMDMVYGVEAGDDDAYLEIWQNFIQRWNYLLPEVPLYSNIYVSVFPDWLEGYDQSSYWDFNQAILYADIVD